MLTHVNQAGLSSNSFRFSCLRQFKCDGTFKQGVYDVLMIFRVEGRGDVCEFRVSDYGDVRAWR